MDTSPGSVSRIVRETGIPRSTVSYRLKKLLGQGLVVVTSDAGSKHSPGRMYRIAVVR